MDPNRTLTDADIEALIKAVEEKFYGNLGKGLWSIFWKFAIAAMIAIAAYGSYSKHG